MEEKPLPDLKGNSGKSADRAIVEMSGFRKLYVWREGKSLAVAVHRLTMDGPFAEDSSFRDQVRRSAIRVPSDIAGGDESFGLHEAAGFLQSARSALARLWTQLEIAHDIDYISDAAMADMSGRCRKLDRMLGGLIKSRATTVQ